MSGNETSVVLSPNHSTAVTNEDTNTSKSGSFPPEIDEPNSKRARLHSGPENSDTLELSSSSGTIRCPYLDTIDRAVLDFDFEKLCSISLSNNNVYACLVCCKYFQVRNSINRFLVRYHIVYCRGEDLVPTRTPTQSK